MNDQIPWHRLPGAFQHRAKDYGKLSDEYVTLKEYRLKDFTWKGNENLGWELAWNNLNRDAQQEIVERIRIEFQKMLDSVEEEWCC